MLRTVGRSLRSVWGTYEHSLHTHPIRTQAITSGLLWALGDVFSQKIEGTKRTDYKRALMTAGYGIAFIGPVGHGWYVWLDRFATRRFQVGSPGFIATKVALDEGVFGPIHVLGFFAYMTLAEGGSWKDVKAKCKRDFWSAYAAELLFWPAFQAVNFWKIPVRHQLLAVNLACLLDATFLCWIQQQDNWVEKLFPGLGKGSVVDSEAALPEVGAHNKLR